MIIQKVVDWTFPYDLESTQEFGLLILAEVSENPWIKLISSYDYELIKRFNVNYNVISLFKNTVYYYLTNDQKICTIDLETHEVSRVEGPLLPILELEDVVCYHNVETKQYEIRDRRGKLLNSLDRSKDRKFKFLKNGIISHTKKNAEEQRLSLLNIINGGNQWTAELPGSIMRIQEFQEGIIIEVRISQGSALSKISTIALNKSSGRILWQREGSIGAIDLSRNIMLSSDTQIIELDLFTGKVLFKSSMVKDLVPMTSSTSSIFYCGDNGLIGELNRDTDQVVWEDQLRNKDGQILDCLNMMLLGNGSLLVQPKPLSGIQPQSYIIEIES